MDIQDEQDTYLIFIPPVLFTRIMHKKSGAMM